jgi:DNA-binding NarL/FixJ family response regulator
MQEDEPSAPAVDRRPNTEERLLLSLLLAGNTVAEAARRLFVSSRTAETMVARLKERAKVRTLYELGAEAERMGWHEAAT